MYYALSYDLTSTRLCCFFFNPLLFLQRFFWKELLRSWSALEEEFTGATLGYTRKRIKTLEDIIPRESPPGY